MSINGERPRKVNSYNIIGNTTESTHVVTHSVSCVCETFTSYRSRGVVL